MNFYRTEIQADRSFPLQTTCMAKSTFRKNTAKTSLNSLLIHCAARQFDPRWVHRIKGSIRQNIQSADLKTETKMWNFSSKSEFGR